MMHGYLAFDADDELLVPFRTWRNTTTGARGEPSSPSLFGTNIPLRWSVAHLHQAVLDDEPHVPEVRFVTTLAGYVHWRSPAARCSASATRRACSRSTRRRRTTTRELLGRFDGLVADRAPALDLAALLPEVLVAGAAGRRADRRGRRAARPDRARCGPASRCARPRATPAPAWSRRNAVAPRTGNVSAGTSIFAMVVLERPLRAGAPRARPRHHARRRPRRDGALQQRRERAGRLGRAVRPVRRRRGHTGRLRTPCSRRCSARRSRARRMPAGCSPTTTSRASRSPGSTRAARCSCAPPTAGSRSRTSCARSSTASSAR